MNTGGSDNTAAIGETTHKHSRPPTTASSTQITADQNAPLQPTTKRPLKISDFVMLYLTISGPPLRLEPKPERADQVLRIRQSIAWHPPSVRAVLWSNSQTRLSAFDFWLKPQEAISAEEARKVDLRNVAIPTRLEFTQQEFWKSMSRIYPSREGSPYYISEWTIVCPKCAKEVVGYTTDKLWNERFLNHQVNSCRKMSGW